MVATIDKGIGNLAFFGIDFYVGSQGVISNLAQKWHVKDLVFYFQVLSDFFGYFYFLAMALPIGEGHSLDVIIVLECPKEASGWILTARKDDQGRLTFHSFLQYVTA